MRQEGECPCLIVCRTELSHGGGAARAKDRTLYKGLIVIIPLIPQMQQNMMYLMESFLDRMKESISDGYRDPH